MVVLACYRKPLEHQDIYLSVLVEIGMRWRHRLPEPPQPRVIGPDDIQIHYFMPERLQAHLVISEAIVRKAEIHDVGELPYGIASEIFWRWRQIAQQPLKMISPMFSGPGVPECWVEIKGFNEEGI